MLNDLFSFFKRSLSDKLIKGCTNHICGEFQHINNMLGHTRRNASPWYFLQGNGSHTIRITGKCMYGAILSPSESTSGAKMAPATTAGIKNPAKVSPGGLKVLIGKVVLLQASGLGFGQRVVTVAALPAAAHCLEQVNQRLQAGLPGADGRLLGVVQRALGIEHLQVGDKTGAVA